MEDNGIERASDLKELIDTSELSLLATIAATLKTVGASKFKRCVYGMSAQVAWSGVHQLGREHGKSV